MDNQVFFDLLEGDPPTAVVFDCDGLLSDTESCWTAARAVQFSRRGMRFGEGEQEELLGLALPDVAARMAARFGEHSGESEIAAQMLLHATVLIHQTARPMPGAVRVVTQVARMIPVAVASNAPRAVLDVTLAAIGLGGLLPVTIAVDDVAAPKPAPDVYLAACALLGVAPADALAFEDSPAGLRAARRAGLTTVAVTADPRPNPDADVTVRTLMDPGLAAWMTSWGSGPGSGPASRPRGEVPRQPAVTAVW